ncbi:transposase [Dactylosporangium cerinum]|uniref:Transposase n=1 Tax=Dactylosporangium cerinum TaxID=1434730 RepID=A0ABV9WE90_9ACTN
MFLRFTSRTNADGSVVRYVALAHNRRVDGRVKPDVLMNLGRADQVDVAGLRRLAASINRHYGDARLAGTQSEPWLSGWSRRPGNARSAGCSPVLGWPRRGRIIGRTGFFSAARWQVDQLGLALFDLVLTRLVADGADLHLAVDDTAHRRRGKKVHGAGWIHDGSAPARNKLAFGHRWVVVGVIVRPSLLSRPLCLPVLCRRWRGKGTASTVELAAHMITAIAARVPGRRVHVVAGAAYHGKSLRDLPTQVARYAARWAIEVTFFDTRQTLGVGQARNRTAQAVNRTWAFGMYVYTIVVLWYALHGHRSGIVTDRHIHAPWYLSKTDPSFADMLTALRRTLIAARFMGSRPAQPTNAEIRQVQRAWALAAP